MRTRIGLLLVFSLLVMLCVSPAMAAGPHGSSGGSGNGGGEGNFFQHAYTYFWNWFYGDCDEGAQSNWFYRWEGNKDTTPGGLGDPPDDNGGCDRDRLRQRDCDDGPIGDPIRDRLRLRDGTCTE